MPGAVCQMQLMLLMCALATLWVLCFVEQLACVGRVAY